MNLGAAFLASVSGYTTTRSSGTVPTVTRFGTAYACLGAPLKPKDDNAAEQVSNVPHEDSEEVMARVKGRDGLIEVHHIPGERAPPSAWNSSVYYKEKMQDIVVAKQGGSGPSNLAMHLVQPRGNSNMKYPNWVSPYLDQISSFYFENSDDFKGLTKEDMRYLLSAYAQLYSFVNAESKSFSTFLFGSPKKNTLFKQKTLEHLGCFREPVTGNEFTVRDRVTGEFVMDYVFRGDIAADKYTFYNFVQSRLASKVIGSGFEDLVMDPGMEKYKTMYCDAMLNGEGTECLFEQREYRDQNLRNRFLLKMSLTTTSTLPCTIDKFNYHVPSLESDPDGLVLLYGSGDSTCALRYNWRNVYCVDPLWNGPPGTGFKGTHKQFHMKLDRNQLELPSWPKFIVSDACGYTDQRKTLMEGFRSKYTDNATRAMDPEITNNISADIVEYWIGKGYSSHDDNGEWFAMKSGVSLQYPRLYEDMVADSFRKTRPTNAELSTLLRGPFYMEVDNHREPISPTAKNISWARACARQNFPIWVGNNQRMYHERTNTFPERTYSYPENFSRCMDNARRNAILVMPYLSDDAGRDEIRERKSFSRGVDFDELEHISEPGSFIRSSDSSYQSVQLYYESI